MLTRIKLGRSAGSHQLSRQLTWFCEHDLITITTGNEDHMELEWDGGQAGGLHDFKPTLPLSVRW